MIVRIQVTKFKYTSVYEKKTEMDLFTEQFGTYM